jgi:predicted N-acetyltransferase YhbS
VSPALADVVVRPVATDGEIMAWHVLSAETFSSSGDVIASAQRNRQHTDALRDFLPRQRRGAFRADELVGGFIIWERWLQVGRARLPIGCIGSVMTASRHRLGGIGTALMCDSIAYSEEHGHALQLLVGIPNFYHHWGYVDVSDLSWQFISRAAVAAIEGPTSSVRAATIDDAPALLDLYQRHYYPHVGSFARSLEQQQERIAFGVEANNPPTVVVDGDGVVRGYLVLPRSLHSPQAYEVAADNWPAVAGLLRYHSERVESSPEPASELNWPLPPSSHTLALLVDHLTVPGRQLVFESGDRLWAVRGETLQQRNAGWMARLVSLPLLLEGMLPAFQARVAERSPQWQGTFALRVDGVAGALRIGGGNLALGSPSPHDLVADLTGAHIMQLMFGYRSISYLAASAGAAVPAELLPVLDTLFPRGQPWIPGTDGF